MSSFFLPFGRMMSTIFQLCNPVCDLPVLAPEGSRGLPHRRKSLRGAGNALFQIRRLSLLVRKGVFLLIFYFFAPTGCKGRFLGRFSHLWQEFPPPVLQQEVSGPATTRKISRTCQAFVADKGSFSGSFWAGFLLPEGGFSACRGVF